MSHISPDAVTFVTMGLACLAMFLCRRRIALAISVVSLITIAGWILTVLAVDAAVPVAMKEMQDKSISTGVPLTLSEQLYDGTGDRVASICMGWFAGVAGALVGALFSLPAWIKAWRDKPDAARRGFDIAPPSA